MASFEDLLTAYNQSPTALQEAVDALSPQARYDLALENHAAALHGSKVEENTYANMPREWRRLPVRWDHFDYLLSYYDRDMFEHHLAPHLPLESEGNFYIRNLLLTLVWKAYKEPAEDAALELTAS